MAAVGCVESSEHTVVSTTHLESVRSEDGSEGSVSDRRRKAIAN